MNEDYKDIITNEIYKEVWAYYYFHSEISKYFNEGLNLEPNGHEQEIYFVDYNWIKSWKKYTNYENVILMGKDYKSLKENGLLEYGKENYPRNIESGRASIIFLAKIVYEIEDFDCLIDKATYDLFKRYNNHYYITNIFISYLDSIKCIFFEEMFALLIEKLNRIKIIYKRQIHFDLELFQFNIDFKFKYVDLLMKTTFNFFFSFQKDSIIDNYYHFKQTFLKNKEKRSYLIDLLTKEYESKKDKIYIKDYDCKITNVILLKKHFQDNDNINLFLNNLNSCGFKGLKIEKSKEETHFKNGIIKCLINLKQLTNNYFYIKIS